MAAGRGRYPPPGPPIGALNRLVHKLLGVDPHTQVSPALRASPRTPLLLRVTIWSPIHQKFPVGGTGSMEVAEVVEQTAAATSWNPRGVGRSIDEACAGMPAHGSGSGSRNVERAVSARLRQHCSTATAFLFGANPPCSSHTAAIGRQWTTREAQASSSKPRESHRWRAWHGRAPGQEVPQAKYERGVHIEGAVADDHAQTTRCHRR